MDSRRILQQLYLPPRAPRAWSARLQSLRTRSRRWLARRSWKLAAAACVLSGWLLSHAHYYNTLTELECQVHEAKAQIQAQEQRRHHIRTNLVAVIKGYTRYEERVLTALTELRTGISGQQPVLGGDRPPLAQLAPPPSPPSRGLLPPGVPAPGATAAAPGASATPATPAPPPQPELRDLLSQLRIVAEQYPDLKLTQNLQQVSQSIIDSETEIARRVMAYNDAVNAYTTVLDTFPGNIFGHLSGFRSHEFYKVDEFKLQYKELSF